MKPLDYLKKYVINSFKELLKVDNKEIVLIENRNYLRFLINDSFSNCFSLNFREMIKNGGIGIFEINDLFYKYISIMILREINNERYSNKFYRELMILSSFLKQYNISPINLIKLKYYPDFLIEEDNEGIYLLEIFFCKDENDWKENKESLDWSLANSNEDLNKSINRLQYKR